MNRFIDGMINSYHSHGIRESAFEWLKSDERACFLVLLMLLINDTKFDYFLSIEKDNYLNLQSGSIYYSIIAWFDKFTEPRNQRSGRRENEGKLNKYHEKCMVLESNLVSSWLLSMNDLGEINYCYNYLQRLGMNTLAVVMNSDRVEFIFRLGEKYNINRKVILIAFFDYLYLLSDVGVFAAENLKMKMASGLSSWKNRRNKEGYVDVHFDIKKENISNLDDLWTVYQRLQENLIKGGLSGRNAKGERARTRSVNGIDGDIKLNQALWVMTEKMYEHFSGRERI